MERVAREAHLDGFLLDAVAAAHPRALVRRDDHVLKLVALAGRFEDHVLEMLAAGGRVHERRRRFVYVVREREVVERGLPFAAATAVRHRARLRDAPAEAQDLDPSLVTGL